MDKAWDARVQGALSAIARTRYSFIATVIFSVAVIVAEYNSHFSWYVGFAKQLSFPQPGPDGIGEVPRISQEELVRNWIGSNRVSISLFGINFGMSDAAILGSTTLYIMSIWLFYAARRENHLIATLLHDAHEKKDLATIEWIYHAISSNLVFITVSEKDTAIDNLADARNHQGNIVHFVRAEFVAMLFLPFFAIAFIFCSDISSLLASPFVRWPRQDGDILLQHIVKSIGTTLFLLSMLVFCGFLGALTLNLCRRIREFQVATGKILQDFYTTHISSKDGLQSGQKIFR